MSDARTGDDRRSADRCLPLVQARSLMSLAYVHAGKRRMARRNLVERDLLEAPDEKGLGLGHGEQRQPDQFDREDQDLTPGRSGAQED